MTKLSKRSYALSIAAVVLASGVQAQTMELRRYRVCAGEYERSCQPHDSYLYCYTDVLDWAQRNLCQSATIRRLNTYGGNKCGYSIDEITCQN